MSLEILTCEEAAARLKADRRTIVRMCAAGQLPGAAKVGRSWRVPESAIAALFAAPTPATSAEGVREVSTEIPVASAPRRKPARGGRRAEALSSRGHAYPDAATDGAAFLRMLPGGERRERAPRRRKSGSAT